ncbi:class B sortase [Eubacteriales bacterium OttesenSCG-928-N13]|nr:class B sortase [Eubacteriales bacterium OttesenSCG-928-N13]
MAKQKTRKGKLSRLLWRLLTIAAITGALVTALVMLSGILDYRAGEQSYAKVRQQAALVQPVAQQDKYQPKVALDELSKINQDLVGWLQIDDTPIDYPVVQGNDNDQYLTIAFDGSAMRSGSLFLDSRCSPDLLDANHLIYGHNMQDGSMFGSLKQFLAPAYLAEHRQMRFIDEERTYNLVPYAIYHAKGSGGDYMKRTFSGEDEYLTWQQQAISRSLVEMDTQPDATLRTMTLVTCQSGARDDRLVMQTLMQLADGAEEGPWVAETND